MPFELYPYQRAAVNSINDYFRATGGNPLIEIPTGGGKSIVIGTFIKEAIEAYPETRITVLAHVPELLLQNYGELIDFWPEAPAGIYSAKLQQRNIHRQILFAGIQSIHRKAHSMQPPDIIMIDEAHLIPRKSNTMYRRFLADVAEINPHVKLIGFSATLFRMDSGMLHQGEDAIFDDICFSVNVRSLIDDGYLCRPVSKSATAQIDTSNVGTTNGEFTQKQLAAVANDPATIAKIADEIVANSGGRNGILIFGCGVANSKALQAAMIERGISCGTIFGETPADERKRTLQLFKTQRIRALSSMGVLTTGFNAKHVDMIALARATKSRGLYIQIIGRGTRLFPGKSNCMVLDFGGNIARHGPIDEIKPLKKYKEKDPQAAPMKICPECGSATPISSSECEECGYVFPPMESKIDTVASTLDIMSRKDLTPTWVAVNKVIYARHKKANSPDSFRVTYQCGLLQHHEWICIEHEGSIKASAVSWFKRRLPDDVPVPESVTAALKIAADVRTIDWPREIAIRPNGKYIQIIGYRNYGRD